MSEILFPRYRGYVETRRDANNAMMALLAGSRLAAHTLRLTDGSDRLLPEIFPQVSHIQRFNLKTEAARNLLLDADSHLGALTVTYALSVHEDFVTDCIDWLDQQGRLVNPTGKQVRAWNMHTIVFASMGTAASHPALALFEVLREMRNCQVHAGGVTSSGLATALGNLDGTASQAWNELTGQAASDIVVDGRVRFTAGAIVAAFAVTKQLGRDINMGLTTAIPRSEWLGTAVRDHVVRSKKTKNSDGWMRSLRGYARSHYGPLALGDGELEDAAISEGFWTRPRGSVPTRQGQKKGGSSY